MDKLDPVNAPPPIPRAPATRRERRRKPPDQPGHKDQPQRKDDAERSDTDDDHTIDEYV